MTRNQDRDYGIITGEKYPQDLTGSDIAACDLENKVMQEVCARGFENELQKRKHAVETILDNLEANLQNAKTTSNEFQTRMKDLQDKIKNIEAELTNYVAKFYDAREKLTAAVNALSIAKSHYKSQGGCLGNSPELDHQCFNARAVEVTKKTSLRDKSKTVKEKAEQDLNSHKATLTDLLAKHQDAQEILNKLTHEKTDSELLLNGISDNIATVAQWASSHGIEISGGIEQEGVYYTEL